MNDVSTTEMATLRIGDRQVSGKRLVRLERGVRRMLDVALYGSLREAHEFFHTKHVRHIEESIEYMLGRLGKGGAQKNNRVVLTTIANLLEDMRDSHVEWRSKKDVREFGQRLSPKVKDFQSCMAAWRRVNMESTDPFEAANHLAALDEHFFLDSGRKHIPKYVSKTQSVLFRCQPYLSATDAANLQGVMSSYEGYLCLHGQTVWVMDPSSSSEKRRQVLEKALRKRKNRLLTHWTDPVYIGRMPYIWLMPASGITIFAGKKIQAWIPF